MESIRSLRRKEYLKRCIKIFLDALASSILWVACGFVVIGVIVLIVYCNIQSPEMLWGEIPVGIIIWALIRVSIRKN